MLGRLEKISPAYQQHNAFARSGINPLVRLGTISPAWQRLWLVALCAVLFCLQFTWTPLTEIDETRFCGATWEMMHSGQYLLPTFNHLPRLQKPILYYWMQAGIRAPARP